MPMEAACHGCGATAMRSFYEVDAIPVHSCLLMDTPEEARSYPTRDLRLALCDRCGFIQNQLFDPALHEYSPRYEESQGFSAHFNRFAESLARELIGKYDLRGKEVLEIGCGKGEFLLSLCEQGAGSGIGIDPGYVPHRLTGDAADRVRFLQELYTEEHTGLTGDLVCCRHTLEHIQPVREFLALVRRSQSRRPGAIAFFEVPDTWRVLEECAFWDIYYEHCSYFTLGSLGRLFEHGGFRIRDLTTAFGDQYLLIEADLADPGRPGSDASGHGTEARGMRSPDDLALLREGVARFQREVVRNLRDWRERLGRWREQGRRVALWGSGSKGVAFLTTLKVSDEVACVVDINPFRQGKCMPGTGHRIISPESLLEQPPDVVVVMNPVYVEEIGRELAERGLTPRILALGDPRPDED